MANEKPAASDGIGWGTPVNQIDVHIEEIMFDPRGAVGPGLLSPEVDGVGIHV
ncbi:hypothetical protein [Micromonospora tulbaghiae]